MQGGGVGLQVICVETQNLKSLGDEWEGESREGNNPCQKEQSLTRCGFAALILAAEICQGNQGQLFHDSHSGVSNELPLKGRGHDSCSAAFDALSLRRRRERICADQGEGGRCVQGEGAAHNDLADLQRRRLRVPGVRLAQNGAPAG